MKRFYAALLTFGLSLSLSPAVWSDDLASTCAALQMQLSKMDPDTRRSMQQGAMADVIKMCSKEKTSSYKKAMTSGTLYCKSGDLCAKYDFALASDRKIYEPSCAQVASCPSNYSDKCTLKNDKVRGGQGTVDWTLYAYNGLVRDSAKNLKCR
ncbi:hypothetical protein KOI40_02130 [Aestuariicella sp. G3-2]|uniref:hypothetical protein n=1 Tax=Pseudomaricurvus albidus TaxID=2842452 RepID=UPI001C0E6384|nr:hypothetical protein [Aestuariicella albida]MBU3068596.1 hypothetical protein [Aestuariicella albida]